MKRLYLSLFGLAALAFGYVVSTLPTSAQVPQPRQADPRTVEIQGKIIRTGTDQLIVQTRDNRQVTLFVNPQSKFMMRNKAVLLTDLRAGANINAVYVTQG